MRPSQDAGPAYWIFVPAVLFPAIVLWSIHGRPEGFWALCLFVLVPALCGICLRAARHTIGASICAVIVLAWYWFPPLLLLLVLNAGVRRVGGLVLIVYSVMYTLPLGVFAMAATISFARRVGGLWALSPVVIALIPTMLLVLVAENHERSKYSGPHAADFMALVPDILTFHKCNQEFSRANPVEGYAESLQQLGPQGSQCLPGDFVNGAAKGFTIRYKPGSRGTDGKIDKYSLSVWETSPQATWTTLYGDESGLTWYRGEGSTPTRAWLVPLAPQYDFPAILRCLEEPDYTRVRVYQRGELLNFSSREDYVRNCVGGASTANTFSLNGYEYRFGFSANQYEVNARPAPYGVKGVRSFLAIGNFGDDGRLSTLNVYATPQDRSATTDDPLAKAEELGIPSSSGLARQVMCGNQLCR